MPVHRRWTAKYFLNLRLFRTINIVTESGQEIQNMFVAYKPGEYKLNI